MHVNPTLATKVVSPKWIHLNAIKTLQLLWAYISLKEISHANAAETR